jgi:hypothetical protein
MKKLRATREYEWVEKDGKKNFRSWIDSITEIDAD